MTDCVRMSNWIGFTSFLGLELLIVVEFRLGLI